MSGVWGVAPRQVAGASAPVFSPGTDAGRVCTRLCTMQSQQSIHSLSPGKGGGGKDAEKRAHKALHDAKQEKCPNGDSDREFLTIFNKMYSFDNLYLKLLYHFYTIL